MPQFKRIAVVGAGLIGGSVLLAAARRQLAGSLAGWSRSPEARALLKSYAVAEIFDNPVEAVQGADIVIVATPVDKMAETFRAISPGLSPGAIVTDAGSVKAAIQIAARGLPPGVHFVGAHPMAGSEKAGSANANADLFVNRPCFVTPTGQESLTAVQQTHALWQALGCRTVECSAQRHDEIVAAISHVPHASASALMLAVGSLPGFDPTTAGAGLKDATRIAAGEENLWVGILLANAPYVIAGLRAAEEQTAQLRKALEAGDAEKVRQLLADARVLRQSLDRPV
jgi:prephenate dehydrogenase